VLLATTAREARPLRPQGSLLKKYIFTRSIATCTKGTGQSLKKVRLCEERSDAAWRAVTDPLISHVAFVLIYVFEFSISALALFAAIKM
jgi:hypothetical protein